MPRSTLADWKGFAARKAASKKRGKLRGIGIAQLRRDRRRLSARARRGDGASEGRVELVLGTMNSGQGHETSFAQLLTEWLGVPFEQHRLRGARYRRGSRSVAARIPAARCGRPASSSARHPTRSSRRASGSPRTCSRSASIDIEFTRGPLRASKAPTARTASSTSPRPRQTRTDLPEDLQRQARRYRRSDRVGRRAFPPARMSARSRSIPRPAWCGSCDWTGVDDVGLAVNPLILHGQTHGAAAQGIGQALMEQCHYDRDSGQMLSASFMDYAMPRADVLPSSPRNSSRCRRPPIARHPAGRRRRHHAGAGRRGQRGRRCAVGVRRAAMSRCRRRPSASGARSNTRRRQRSSSTSSLRSEAKQSRAAYVALDCFASLAMTKF